MAIPSIYEKFYYRSTGADTIQLTESNLRAYQNDAKLDYDSLDFYAKMAFFKVYSVYMRIISIK